MYVANNSLYVKLDYLESIYFPVVLVGNCVIDEAKTKSGRPVRDDRFLSR